MASQLQADIKDLWEEYKTKPISFTDFIKVQQIELEDLFDKKISGKDKYLKKPDDYAQKHKYRQKSHSLKGTTATNEAKVMEWKASDNARDVVANELKAKGLALDWVGNF